MISEIADSIINCINDDNKDQFIKTNNINNGSGITLSFFNKKVCQIKYSKKKNSHFIEIPNSLSEYIDKSMPLSTSQIKGFIRFDINTLNTMNQFFSTFQNIYSSISNTFTSINSFSCCHLYEECSNQKKCTHNDINFSNACRYKKNLENGRIFYGKNKNV